MTATLIIGDVLDVLRSMPDASVDMVMTSPPFLALRSYLPADHPDKAKEMGSEPTPGEFIDALLDVTEELARVVAPHGSICIELGDTYSGSGGAGGDYGIQGLRDGQPKFEGSGRRNRPADVAAGILAPTKRPGPEGRDKIPGWPLAKSLCLIPELYRIALVYGFNPLTGRQTPTWRARNVVRWHRPNPPVGALGDKFRPATSDMVIACKARDRYFDLDAVRTPSDYDRPNLKGMGARGPGHEVTGQKRNHSDHTVNEAGAPPLDTWTIPTSPFKGSHYATFPPALCVKPILAMCPERVCTVCGEPSRRIVGDAEYVPSATNRGGSMLKGSERVAEGVNQWIGDGGASASVIRQAPTLGWTDCGHDVWRPGIVLDPFVGSGTVLAVATGHGRGAIGIDLDARNADLCRERVGMFLEVQTHVTEVVA